MDMLWQFSGHGMYKIVTESDHYFSFKNNMRYDNLIMYKP